MTELEPESEPELDVSDRLRRLEIGAEVQAQALTAIHEMLLEADRLNESIGRLGDGAGSLSAALLQVDAQQKVLHQLGQDITKVRTESSTHGEVDSKVAQVEARTRRERKRMMHRVYAGAIVGLALLGAVGLGVVNSVEAADRERQVTCERQIRTNAAVVSYLEDVRRVSNNPVLADSAGQVIDALPSADVDPKEVCQ